MKKILLLTAGYGEGHNAAARGILEGLAQVAPEVEVQLRDLFAETFGAFHVFVRNAYLTLINHWPRSWGYVYRWLDRKRDFDKSLARFVRIKKQLTDLLASFQPDVVVSVFPAYPYLLELVSGRDRRCKSVVVVTDSITVNRIWYGCQADYFFVPNERSADVLRAEGIPPERIKAFGFPVSPKFAECGEDRRLPLEKSAPHVLYMINAGTRSAPDLVRRLLDLELRLTVTVGRDERLRRAIEAVAKASSERNRKIEIVGWTDQLPSMLCASHLLIGKAGGAAVQEAIAARCPMIINHIVSGQEEGNARLITETNSGTIALSPDEVVAQVQRAFADDARQWREWEANITKLSRPRASLEIARFLASL